MSLETVSPLRIQHVRSSCILVNTEYPKREDFKSETMIRGKAIRPLPAIPTVSPLSATQQSPGSQSFPRKIRPLPSPPSQSPVSPTPTVFLCENVTPPNPVIIQPPQPPSTSTSRPKLPALLTSPDFLNPPTAENVPSNPNSPGYPQPPTPQTAKRRRIAKLRRHLGEPILDETIYARGTKIVTTQTRHKVGGEARGSGEDNTYLRAAIVVSKILGMKPDEISGSSSEGSDETGEDGNKDEDYSWVLENGIAFRTSTGQQHSRKWIHEKGYRRWEEPDYSNVIQALRAL